MHTTCIEPPRVSKSHTRADTHADTHAHPPTPEPPRVLSRRRRLRLIHVLLFMSAYKAYAETRGCMRPSRSGPNGYRAVIQHALLDGFAETEMTAKPDATDSQHCIDMGMDELHPDAPFTENNYLVATDRAHLTTDLPTFASEVVGVIHDSAFYTVLQHAIKEETGVEDHSGSDVEIVKESPKLIGFIVIEGPPGSAEMLQKSNGPIF